MARRRQIDLSRIAASALETALNGEEPPRRRFSGAKALATGAVLAAAARVAVSKAPSLPRVPGVPHLPDFSELSDSVRDRLVDYGVIHEPEPADEDEEFDEEPEDEESDEEFDEEPESEADDDEPEDEGPEEDDGDDDEPGPEAEGEDVWDEEDEEEEEDVEDEPQGEADDDWDEEDAEEDEGPEGEAEPPPIEVGTTNGGEPRRTPDLMRVLNEHGSPPPLRRRRARSRGSDRLDPVARPPEPPKREDAKEKPKKSKAKAGRS